MGTRRSNGSGTIFKRNGWYYFRNVGTDGRVFCRSCKTKDKNEAEQAAKDFSIGEDLPRQARLAAVQEFLKENGANPLLDEAYQKYVSHPKNIAQSQGAKNEDAGVWKIFKRWLFGQKLPNRRTNCKAAHPNVKRIDDVTQEIASEFIKSYQASPQTKNKFIRILKRIWTFCGASSNPWSRFSKLKTDHAKRRALTNDEVNTLIEAAQGEMKLLFLLGAYTGLRMTDCATIRWNNISDNFHTLTITPHKTKHSSGAIVRIPIHQKIVNELKTKRGSKKGFLCPNLASMPRWKLSDCVNDHFAKCGLIKRDERKGYKNTIPTVGFHSLRSTYISNMANAGAPLAMVQAIVGHMSPELTQMYYRSDVERAREFVEKL